GVAPALSRSLREAVLAACMNRNIHSVMQVAQQTSTEKNKVLWHFSKRHQNNRKLQTFRFVWRKKSDAIWTGTPNFLTQPHPTSCPKRSSSYLGKTKSSNTGQTHTQTISTKGKSKETFLRRLRDRYEAPFKPIRNAREHSVLKTACPAPCTTHRFEDNLR